MKNGAIAQLRKKITKFGINPDDLGIFTKPKQRLQALKIKTDNQQLRER